MSMPFLVITGGSRGIGKATIELFLKHQWKVINLSRTPCEIKEVINIKTDLSDISSLPSIAPQLKDLLANASAICLVHNASFYQHDAIGSLSLSQFQQTLNVNVVAPAALNEILIPLMKPGSSILYIGTTLAEMAVPNAASYVVSKHALVGLMRSTYQDLADRSIRSLCICPGLVNTDMLHDTMNTETQNYLLQNVVIAKRLIEPKEIADVIYFSATNPVLNGIVLHANLGQVGN